MGISESDYQALLRRTGRSLVGMTILGPETPQDGLSPVPGVSDTRKPGNQPYTERKRQPRMNKTESRFAQYLELLKKAGEIESWWFGDWTFRLADDYRYTPDFVAHRVWEAPNDIWVNQFDIYDVKGRKKRKDGVVTYWCEEDAKGKIKVAAKLWPMFNWVITYPLPNGEWATVPVKEPK